MARKPDKLQLPMFPDDEQPKPPALPDGTPVPSHLQGWLQGTLKLTTEQATV